MKPEARQRSVRAKRDGALLLAFVLAACTRSPEAKTAGTTSKSPPTAAELYLPLEHDTVYAYATRVDTTNERGMLVMAITRPRDGRADLDVAGRAKRVEIGADGIRYLGGGYLLKMPLEPGASFQGRTGTVRVSSVDRTVETPAGRFDGCIETVEESGGGATMSRVVSIYCPAVGLVSLDIEAEDDRGYSRERALLKSYGKRVDLGTSEP